MTITTESALKPCPFCGGEAVMWNGKGTQADVGCEDCGCERGIQVRDILEYDERFAPGNEFSMETLSYPPHIVEKAKAELIKMWNERS